VKLEPIRDYLVAQAVAGGNEIFIHTMPDTVQKGILLLSPLSGTTIDHELPGYLKGSFQAIARAPRYVDGEALAEAMSRALTIKNQAMGIYKVNYIRPRHLAIPYQHSKANLLEFSVNFDVCLVSIG
jgi:hypothetical protein